MSTVNSHYSLRRNKDCARQPACRLESGVPYTLTLASSVGLWHPQVDNTH